MEGCTVEVEGGGRGRVVQLPSFWHAVYVMAPPDVHTSAVD